MCYFLEPNQYGVENSDIDVSADMHTFKLNDISALKHLIEHWICILAQKTCESLKANPQKL